nr:MAG TPA: hypothetical protein [Caudoviricetes sp.]
MSRNRKASHKQLFRWSLVKYSTWYWVAACWRLSSGFSR